MYVLAINSGSSSFRASVVHHKDGTEVAELRVERIGGDAQLWIGSESSPCDAPDHGAAVRVGLPKLLDQLPTGVEIEAVGHRVVHGGERFAEPVLIDDEVESAIEAISPLAPLHNPANLAGIRASRQVLPTLKHVAVFDTGFHKTLPRRARSYAIPTELAARHGIRRFGFHGISHAFVCARAAEYLEADLRDLRIISCHLGNGASIAAVEYGRSVETSMGLTPLEGLVMGTRSGDIDPGALLHLMRAEGLDIDGLDHLLNRESGLAGLSGVGNDMRDIEARAAEGDEACRLAIHVCAHRVRKYIGAYAAVMGGADAIVFTAGIGENSSMMRHRIAQRLEYMGARVDEDRNRDVRVTRDAPVAAISTSRARCHVLVVRTDEVHAIAEQAWRVATERSAVKGKRTIPVAVSARHIHLKQETVEALFGPGHQLTERNPLSQPGQFACHETVNLIGPKRTIENVRVLGPTRSKDQVEISRTDEFFLGIDAPVRASGDVENSPGITLEGPYGRVEIKQGVICAWRHIHMHPDDAEHFGVKDRDVVEVAVGSEGRSLIFGDVLVRVSPHFALEMHIDTDEANAAELSAGASGALLVATGSDASLRKRETRFDTTT